MGALSFARWLQSNDIDGLFAKEFFEAEWPRPFGSKMLSRKSQITIPILFQLSLNVKMGQPATSFELNVGVTTLDPRLPQMQIVINGRIECL